MEQKSFDFSAIPQTAIKVITQPAAFFREMPKTGGFVEPLIFMVIMGTISGIFQAVFSLLHLTMVGGFAFAMQMLITMPIAALIGGFIGAGIAFVIWKIMGSQEDYETAYRCCAYASAVSPITTVLGIIPYLGAIIGILIGIFYIVMASVEVHKIPAKKAWTVFGIIAAVFILLSLSGQFAARRMANNAGHFQRQMEEAGREMQRSSEQSRKAAEEMGKAAQKQTEEAQKEMQKQAEEMQKASEEMKKQLEEMQKRQKH